MHKRILYCVLDWGLGHASRSIPIIRSLLERECEVVLASDSMTLDLLRSEFPSLISYELTSYNVKYSSDNLLLNGINNFQNIRTAIKAEHNLILEITRKEKIDAVISDNRYGCFVPGILSLLITHQLNFRTGNLVQNRIGRTIINRLIKPFDRIWIPDDENHTLSGVLSMSDDKRVRCIGWQSTLTKENLNKQYKIAAILSGPEPARSTFEIEVIKQLKVLNLNCVLVRGIQGNRQEKQEGNIVVYENLDRGGINHVINSASIVLCRSGYSSLMDLMAIGNKGILIPTPGQPEQKYLGKRMKLNSNYVVQQQNELNIKSAINKLEKINLTQPFTSSSDLLDGAIRELLSLC